MGNIPHAGAEDITEITGNGDAEGQPGGLEVREEGNAHQTLGSAGSPGNPP